MTGIDRTAAFETAYRAHYWHVVAYAQRRLAPTLGADAGREAARDAAQEVFATAWRRRDALPPEPLPWLYAVAAGVVANAQRSGRRRDRLAARLVAVPDAPGVAGRAQAGPTHDARDDLAADPVLGALATLSAGDREVLRLAAWEDLEPRDIATVLGCSPNTAAARLSRAKKRLRAALARPAAATVASISALDPEVDHA